VISVSDSSPLITLSRAHQLELLHDFYAQIAIPHEVYEQVVVAGAGLPGAEEVQGASWIRVHLGRSEPLEAIKAACVGLGRGEQSAIYLASTLGADLVLIDEGRARRAAKAVGLAVAGSIAILERGAMLHKVADLRSVYLDLIAQGIRFDRKLLDQSLATLGLGKLNP
jgi:predicted nucleic acid-binding protein